MKPVSLILAVGIAAVPLVTVPLAASPAGAAAARRAASYECSALSSSISERAKTVGQNCEARHGSPTSGHHEGRVRIVVPTLGAADCWSYDLRDYPRRIVATRCTYEVPL